MKLLLLLIAVFVQSAFAQTSSGLQISRQNATLLREQNTCLLRFRREAVEVESEEAPFVKIRYHTSRHLSCEPKLKAGDEWGSLFDALLGDLNRWRQSSTVDALMQEALKHFAENEYQNFSVKKCGFERGEHKPYRGTENLPFEEAECELQSLDSSK